MGPNPLTFAWFADRNIGYGLLNSQAIGVILGDPERVEIPIIGGLIRRDRLQELAVILRSWSRLRRTLRKRGFRPPSVFSLGFRR